MTNYIPIPPMMERGQTSGTCGGGPELCFSALGNVKAASATQNDGGVALSRVAGAQLDAREKYFAALRKHADVLRDAWTKAEKEILGLFRQAFPEDVKRFSEHKIELTLALSTDLQKVTMIAAFEPKSYMARIKEANLRAAEAAEVRVAASVAVKK